MKKVSVDILKKFLDENELQEIMAEAQRRATKEAWFLELFDDSEKEKYKEINEFLKNLSKKYGLALGIYNNTKRANKSKKSYYKMEG